MWIEIEEEIEQVVLKPKIFRTGFDLDLWHAYWMDVADPRGKYLQDLELHLMTGGGWY